jgi:uncharacterized protein YjbJ (UPF0337 family)
MKGELIVKKHMIDRTAAKATVADATEAMAPGVAEQLAGKAKAEIGKSEQRLGELTGHPEIARAGRKLELEGKVAETVGRVKAAAADAAEHVKAAGERLSEKLKG